ncbi:MAG: SURF1 family protein [Pseudohongiellaceae bacterium]|nr:SURF1 family protein [Pseudohongiellaceae bacterium]
MTAFKPGWKMTLFTLLFCPILFQMGMWQLEREQQKLVLQQRYDSRQTAAPLDFSDVDWQADDLSFLNISANGSFDNARSFLLDNRINNSRVGYEILTPFTTQSGETLLVNRGWLPQGRTREDIPEIPSINGQVSIAASIYVPLGEAFVLSGAPASDERWPQLIQSIDMDFLEAQLGLELMPYTVRLTQGSIGALTVDWPLINISPEKHRGYAVQWFAMLAALILLYTYFGFKNPNSKKQAEEK